MSPLVLVLISIAAGAFLTGLSKGGLGGGLGALVTPILALAMPASLAIGIALPILIIGDMFAVAAHWGGWDRRIIWRLMPGTLIGVAAGSLVIGSLSPVIIQRVLGGAALLYTLYKLWSRWQASSAETQPVTDGMLHSSVFGAMTGFASALANAGGPIVTIYMLAKQVVPSVFVATLALYFAIVNLSKVPAYLGAHILSPEMAVLFVWAVPLIPLGVWSGKLLDKHIDMRTFETLMLVLLAVTGVLLLVKS